MSKTPDEIKRGLECCQDYLSCTKYDGTQCPYYDVKGCEDALLADALAYIQQLEAQNVELLEKVEQLKSERDALFKEVRGRCTTCKHWDKEPEEEPCASCVALDGQCHNWQWRGVQKEE